MKFEADAETRIAHDHDVYQVEMDGDDLRLICYLNWEDTAAIQAVFDDDDDCEGVIFITTLTAMITDMIDLQSNRVGEVSHGELRTLRTILLRAVAQVDQSLRCPDLDGKYPRVDMTAAELETERKRHT